MSETPFTSSGRARYPGRTGRSAQQRVNVPAVSTLAPAASGSCTAAYTVTQDDIDQGSIVDSVVANGVLADGSRISSNTATAAVTAIQTRSSL